MLYVVFVKVQYALLKCPKYILFFTYCISVKTNVSVLALHMWRAGLQDWLGSSRGTRRGGVTQQLHLQSCVRVEIFLKKCIQRCESRTKWFTICQAAA